MSHSTRLTIICAGIAAAVLAIYGQTCLFDFVNLDDEGYVYGNPVVQSGFSRATIAWAFTNNAMSNWHPLTWLSHMLDVRLFGLRPGGHHFVNVLLHLANSLLLFAVLQRMTKASWPSAFAAALFAVHPLHVESVAWISERKDVLSTLFFFLMLYAYAVYAEARSWRRYIPVAAAFALGLMAKSMLVTAPVLLLLLDIWPLRRITLAAPLAPRTLAPTAARLALEKAPLFAMALIIGLVTIRVQGDFGAVAMLDRFTPMLRFNNAVVSCVKYLLMTIYPAGLAAAYPHLGHTIPAWQVVGSAAFLTAATAAAVWQLPRRPYLLVGWAWYLISLMPVIGIIQVGSQGMADRYTYIPLIGIFLIIAHGGAELAARFPFIRRAAPVAACLCLAALTITAQVQTRYWRNSEALFTRALSLNDNNTIAHNNLGTALMAQNRHAEAAAHFTKALAQSPENISALNNLGAACLMAGQYDKAADAFTRVLRIHPNDPTVHSNLGYTLYRQGHINQAREAINKALQLDPNCQNAKRIRAMLQSPGR